MPKKKLKILFSRHPAWEADLKQSFQGSQHEISFADLNTENIQKFDLVVALTIPELKFLSGVRHLVPENIIPIPSVESILLCDDKYLLNQALIKNGFGEFIPVMNGAVEYPYVLKKRTDEWGVNTHIIANKEQEKNHASASSNPEYFRQVFIPGREEYATHIIFKNGKIICSANIKYIFDNQTPIKGKDKIITSEPSPCPYIPSFSAMLKSIDFSGICCINYKVFNNQAFIIEINPRIGGSLCKFFSEFVDYINKA